MLLPPLRPYSALPAYPTAPLPTTGSYNPSVPYGAPSPAATAAIQPYPADAVSFSPPTQPLPIGAIAPNFTLKNQDGQAVRLYDALSRGPVVLFFYPKDNSFLCTRQVQAFRDAYPYLRQLGASVFGISSDDAKAHQQFIAEQRLPFPLLSDPTQQVRSQYGAQSLGGYLPGRVTMVIDPASRRIRASYSSQTNIGEHIQTALQALQPATQPYSAAFQNSVR